MNFSLKLVSFLSVLLLSCHCAGANLAIVTENYPPFNFSSDGGKTVTGLSTDIVMELARRANIKITVSIYPWSRALKMAENDENTCVISTIRSKERETKYKWIGPIASDTLTFFAAADSDISIKSIDDAKGYTVGTYFGSATIPILEQHGIRYDAAPADNLNPKKMSMKRIDLWVANSKTGFYTALREGIKVKQVLLFGDATDMYLACNKNMPDETVEVFNNILKKMQKDGTIKSIEEKYK